MTVTLNTSSCSFTLTVGGARSIEYAKAIEHYKKGWKLALMAVGKLKNMDDDDYQLGS